MCAVFFWQFLESWGDWRYWTVRNQLISGWLSFETSSNLLQRNSRHTNSQSINSCYTNSQSINFGDSNSGRDPIGFLDFGNCDWECCWWRFGSNHHYDCYRMLSRPEKAMGERNSIIREPE
jgi:hypothetical protein